MKIFIFLRGLLVMALLPVLTFLVSVTALIAHKFFCVSPEKLQILPQKWGRLITKVGGVSVRVEGVEKLDPGRPYIFAANHLSQFDIFALQGYLGFDFRWLAKKELFNIPVFGPAMRCAGYIPVDRSHGRQALKSLAEAAQRIAGGTAVIIFPEGTRSKDGTLHPFKSGGMVLAFKSGVPLVPVAIQGTYEVLPKGKLLAKPGKVLIRVGTPIDTKKYNPKQKQELADRLRSEVAALMHD